MSSITSTIEENEIIDNSPVKNFITQENKIRKLKLQRDIAVILFILSLIIWL